MKKVIIVLALAVLAVGGAAFYMQTDAGTPAPVTAPATEEAAPAESSSNASTPSAAELISGKPQQVPVPGMVTLVDLGAKSCIPCRMMAPILKELSQEYEGRAAIVFIDVWENPDVTPEFGLRAIPTQIFYDAEGKERMRHEGFMDKDAIEAKLKQLGVE